MSLAMDQIKRIIEAAILTSTEPVNLERLSQLFSAEEKLPPAQLRKVLETLTQDYQARGIELKELASGYRFQAQQDLSPWLQRWLEERPPRYSRAFLETLALIAYRQPITRGEIEEIRGVSINSQSIKTFLEREWIKIVGYRDVPGKPALYATTPQFLDYFNLKNLSDLPTLLATNEEQGAEQLALEI